MRAKFRTVKRMQQQRLKAKKRIYHQVVLASA